MKIAKGHLQKLEDRSILLVHLRVEKGSKAYRLLDPDTGKMYVSRDVVFEENRAWTWEKSEKIKATPRISFTVEGFDFVREVYDDEGEWVPDWIKKVGRHLLGPIVSSQIFRVTHK